MQKQWPNVTDALLAYIDDFLDESNAYLSSIAGDDWRELSVTALTDFQIEAWYYDHSGYLDGHDMGRLNQIIAQGNQLVMFFEGYAKIDVAVQRVKSLVVKVLVLRDFLQYVEYRFNICAL